MEEKSIWLHLGTTVHGSGEEIFRILQGNENILALLLEKGKYEIDGESYVLASAIGDYNRENGTEHDEEEMNFYELCIVPPNLMTNLPPHFRNRFGISLIGLSPLLWILSSAPRNGCLILSAWRRKVTIRYIRCTVWRMCGLTGPACFIIRQRENVFPDVISMKSILTGSLPSRTVILNWVGNKTFPVNI